MRHRRPPWFSMKACASAWHADNMSREIRRFGTAGDKTGAYGADYSGVCRNSSNGCASENSAMKNESCPIGSGVHHLEKP